MINRKLTYISLFSSAGVGCYGFKMADYECIATNELIERRLNIQKNNKKCINDSGYILGDITKQETKNKIMDEILLWQRKKKQKDIVDVIIATPPCQGMSVANHKKNNESPRNSLVVESIKMINKVEPKIFIFENVRAFLNTKCIDVDNNEKTIKKAIYDNLENNYKISYKILNFKNYGGVSSRTRTLVIGVRNDFKNIIVEDLFPQYEKEKTMKEVIGDLPSLTQMGQIDENDIYHQFRVYNERMRAWISDINEGQSAFENIDISKIPHTIVDGVIKYNKNLNSDKYTRQVWNKVCPCIHTRNDQLASQSTVHPKDDRVFSIRELMRMMSIPQIFNWTDLDFEELNNYNFEEKQKFLKKNEINIRQSIGEAVPTIIFNKIANNIKINLKSKEYNSKEIEDIIEKFNLNNIKNLKEYVNKNINKMPIYNLYRLVELSNCNRNKHSAFYTDLDICENIVKQIPEFLKDEINILEPSVGAGNFIFYLCKILTKYKKINIDVVDIDKDMLDICKIILDNKITEKNININYIEGDYLLLNLEKKYDLVIGNPPFDKLNSNNSKLKVYKNQNINKETNNLFAFFMEKALKDGSIISLITPKSLLNAPEFDKTREIIKEKHIHSIIDFGEYGFKGIKIETINTIITNYNLKNKKTKIYSYITKKDEVLDQKYITESMFKSWLIYRNSWFDEFVENKKFDVFTVFRDRQITTKMLKNEGKYRVLKSRNIEDRNIVDIAGYDQYIDEIEMLSVKKYINNKDAILIPNLTYNPRACYMPENTIPNGSLAILTPKQGINIKDDDLEFYATDEFKKFYKIARNYGTRSLNIDSNSVEFFCIKENYDE